MVRTEVIVLNGGSSSGKSSIARSLQELLVMPWATLGVDDLISALSPSLVGGSPPLSGRTPLLRLGGNGEVIVEAAWRQVESAWYAGLSAIARTGLGLIVDEVLLRGGTAQRQIADAFEGLALLWVGVHCDPVVAAAREVGRPGRVAGMASSQAVKVHQGVHYDVTVDTTTASSEDCARTILAHLR